MEKILKKAKIKVRYIVERKGKYYSQYIVAVLFIKNGITIDSYLTTKEVESYEFALSEAMAQYGLPLLQKSFKLAEKNQ